MQLRPRRLGLLRDRTATGFRVPVIGGTGRSNEEAYLAVSGPGHLRSSKKRPQSATLLETVRSILGRK